MPVFSYGSGNINNLVAGANASMADIQGSFVDIRDFVNGQLDTSNLSATAALKETQLATGSNGLAKGAFSAYRNAAVSYTTGSTVAFDTEEFDVSGWHDTVTNIGRYTPLVAGYYRLSWSVAVSIANLSADEFLRANLYKNGTVHKAGSQVYQRGTTGLSSVGTALVQANGSTDFFTVVVAHGHASAVSIVTGVADTYFQAELIGRS